MNSRISLKSGLDIKKQNLLRPLAFICLILLSLAGCRDAKPPETTSSEGLGREEIARARYREIQKEFTRSEEEIRKGIRLGNLEPKAIYELDREFRVNLEEFAEEFNGTQSAAGVQLNFVLIDIEKTEFGSAEARLNEIIAALNEGGNLALALIQKSIFESDHNPDKALRIIRKAEKVGGISEPTLIEVKIQKLNILEMLHRDSEFDALYIELMDSDVGPYLGAITLARLHNLIRLNRTDSVEELIDSVEGVLDRGILLLLKGEYTSSKLVGKQAPPVKGKDIAGVDFDLREHRGQVVVIIFFTTRSTLMLRQVEKLNEFYSEFSPHGIRLVGVCLDTEPDGLPGFASEHEILWPLIHDSDVSIQQSYFVVGEPKYFIINEKGIILEQGSDIARLESRFAGI